MKKCLLMLTSAYPYHVGETFLETEIFFHVKNFDKIIILAQEVEPDAPITRKTPDEIDFHNISTKKQKITRVKDIIKGAAQTITPNGISKENAEKSFQKIVFTQYFEQRAQRQFKESLEVLQKYDFSKFDEVVIYSYWFFVTCKTGVLLKDWLKQKGIKASLVSRAHRYDVYENRNRLNFLPSRNSLAREADGVFVCSKDGQAHLKNTLPNFSNKFHSSYLGTFDHGLSSSSKTFHLVTCSRISKIKRLDLLIESLALLKNSNAEIYWTHIGDGEMKNKIIKLAKERLDFMNFEFLGRMTNEQVYEYYKNHPISLFVNVSNSEGLPVSIMEAVSFGIPVLATDVGGTNEIVKDGFNGMLLKPNFTKEDFYKKFSAFLEMDDIKYQNYRSNSRAIWEENFNAANNYENFSLTISNLDSTINAREEKRA